jgi:energy-coupling factor transporter transmembrane protein EcfT
MKTITPIFFYAPRRTFFHQINVLMKLLLFLGYALLAFSARTTWALAGLFLLITAAISSLRLPLREYILNGILLLLILWVGYSTIEKTLPGQLILAAGKVWCLVMLVRLFGSTTKIEEILLLLSPLIPQSALGPLLYSINTTLAVYPSVQYDLQRAIDAETVRRGKKLNILSLGSWFTIIIVVLVRIMKRAERFTDSVLDRGYVPSQVLLPSQVLSRRWQDGIIALAGIISGVLLWLVLS